MIAHVFPSNAQSSDENVFNRITKTEYLNDVYILPMEKGAKEIKIDLIDIKDPFVFYKMNLAETNSINHKMNLEEIRKIRIHSGERRKKAMTWGAIIGGFIGSYINYEISDKSRSRGFAEGFERFQKDLLVAIACGTVGAVLGSLVKAKYTFSIDGNRNNYKKYEKEIQKRLLE